MANEDTNFLRKLRKQKSLTLKELSELTGISFAQLSKIERNIHSSSPENINKIQEILFNYNLKVANNNKEIIQYPKINNDLRYATLVEFNSTCQSCGRKAPYNEIIVSRIDPNNKKLPSNLTTLCEECFIARQKFIEKNGIEEDHIYKQNI